MTDVFGSPKETDSPGRAEKALNAADARINAIWENTKDQYARPIGSQKVDPESEFQEYLAVAGTPEERTQHFAALASQWRQQGMTLAEAVEAALAYERRNEKRLEGFK